MERASGVSSFMLSRLMFRPWALGRVPCPPTGPCWKPRLMSVTFSLPSAL